MTKQQKTKNMTKASASVSLLPATALIIGQKLTSVSCVLCSI